MPITILSFLGRHAPAFLAASIFAALALPDLAHVMAPLLGPSVWGLLVIAIAIMDGITAVLLARPSHVLLAVALGFIANVGLQLATAVLFWKRGRPEALTLGFVSGNRNAGIILAVLPASVDPDIRLYFAMAQFPIYVLPALLRPLYRRLV